MAEDTPPAGKRGFRRPVLITAATVVAVVLLACAGAWAFRLPLAEKAIVYLMKENGISPARLTVESLDLGGITVTDIALGPNDAQRVGHVEVHISLAALRKGEVTSILVRNARLQGRWADDRLHLPGLDSLFNDESGESGPPPLRVARLTVDGAQAVFKSPFGTLHTSLQADATTGKDGLIDVKGGFALRSEGPGLNADTRGSLTATVIPSGEVLARIALENGAVHTPHAAAGSLKGNIQFVRTGTDMSADLTLNAGTAEIDGNPLTDGKLTAGLAMSLSGITVDTRLQANEGRAALTGKVTPDAKEGFRYDGTLALGLDLPTLAAHLNGTLHATADESGRIAGKVDIADGGLALRQKGIEADGLSGTASFTRAGTALPNADATLTIGHLTLPGIVKGHGALTVHHVSGTLQANGNIASDSGDIAFHADLPSGEPLAFTAKGKVEPGTVLGAVTDGVKMAGTVTFDLSGKLDDPLGDPAGLPQRLTATGTVAPDLSALHVAGAVRDGALKGPITIDIHPGAWVLTTPSIRLSGLRLAPRLLHTLPGRLRHRGAAPITLALAGTKDNPVELRVVPDGGSYAATLTGAARLATGKTALSVTGQVQAQMPGTVTGADGHFHLTGSDTEPVGDGMAPVTLRPDLAGQFRLRDNVLTMDTDPSSTLSVDAPDIPDRFRADAPLLLRLDHPFHLRADLRSRPVALTYSGGATLQKSRFTAAGKVIELSAIPLSLKGHGGKLNASLGPVSAELPDYAVAAQGITASLTTGDTTHAEAAIAKIQQRAHNPIVVPLQLAAKAIVKGDQATFTAQLHDASGALSIKASGTHDIATDSGSAHVETGQVSFLPTVLQPKQLFPILGNRVQELNGDIDGKADFQWSGGKLTSSGKVLANVALMKTKEMTLESAATVVSFDSLLPPSTPPEQEIAVGLLDIGIPLSKGRIEFQIRPDGSVTAALRELDMFGGQIETTTFTIPSRLDGFTIPLQVNGVRLADLLDATKVGDLTATGTLNGRIPIVFDNGKMSLRNGYLDSAPGGGTIQYHPQKVGPALSGANEGTALFFDIVKDFQYKSVHVAIDEQPDGTVPFEFKIKGSNKAVYNGAPVEINLSMSGPLRAILQQGLKTYTLPDRLLQRMRKFRGG